MRRGPVDQTLRLSTAAVCTYEALAIVLDREKAPTLSCLAGRHRWLAPGLLIALAIHLWWGERQSQECVR